MLNEEVQATHVGQQVAPLASELPFQRSENSGVVLIEDTGHSHKRPKCKTYYL